MATKQFKIGEYAIGGIIKVTISNSMITIQALDYNSKEVLMSNVYVMTETSYWDMKDFLNELTSSYYAEMVMEYIEEKSNLSKQLFRNY
jgi:hypothetical protein